MKIERGTQVLVTGAASGIGRATALALAGRGARLFLTDIHAAGLQETVQRVPALGGQVLSARAFDIAGYGDVRAFADEIHREFGPVDILMNIAGIALWSLIERMRHEHWVKVIDVNLWGPIHTIECFVPEMIRARKGHVVNVASISGLVGAPWHAAYAASKWGCVGLSEVLRYDLMQHRIGVTVVCPGAVDTPLQQTVELLGVDPEGEAVGRLKQRFSRHAIPPERVARQILEAVEKERFLVITSLDVRLGYLLKRYLPPAFHRLMIYLSRQLNSTVRA
jgi:NAD(P)-dependent dehydrogenase (short-subunit alcohol dehydrogenase family)